MVMPSLFTMRIALFVVAGLCARALPTGTYAKSPSPDRRVWVKYKDGLRSGFLDALTSFTARAMPPVTIHREFPGVSAFVVTATVDEINELSMDPNVEEVVEDVKRYTQHIPESIRFRELQTDEEVIPYGIEMVQATEAHQRGFTGLGARVCVVDTGTDFGHEGKFDFVRSFQVVLRLESHLLLQTLLHLV